MIHILILLSPSYLPSSYIPYSLPIFLYPNLSLHQRVTYGGITYDI
jgi:hypothetical protein